MDGRAFILNSPMSIPSWINDWEMSREFILPKLINKSNLENISNAPYAPYFVDYIVVFVVEITTDYGTYFMMVNRNMVDNWHVSDADIKAAAAENIEDVKFELLDEADFYKYEQNFVEELFDVPGAEEYFEGHRQTKESLTRLFEEGDTAMICNFISTLNGMLRRRLTISLSDVIEKQEELSHMTNERFFVVCESPYSGINILANKDALNEVLEKTDRNYLVMVPVSEKGLMVIPCVDKEHAESLAPYYEGYTKGLNSGRSRYNKLSDYVLIYSRETGIYWDFTTHVCI